MPTLRELQKRLESAETIKQLAGAMRSASTANYTKLCAALDSYSPYAAALRSLSKASGSSDRSDGADVGGELPTLCVLVSGNRGLCGGYHQQLFTFFADLIKDKNVAVVACGKKAVDFCRTKKIGIEESFSLSDVPDFAEAKKISEYCRERYSSGDVGKVVFCFQRFFTMLRCEPQTDVILGGVSGDAGQADDGVIFIPDRSSVARQVEPLTVASAVYDLILSAATAAQASTVIAMRSAYDNATSSISSLEIQINRLRQAAVTASVLETAIDIKE